MKKAIIAACAVVFVTIGCNSNSNDKSAAALLDTSQLHGKDTSKKQSKFSECQGRNMGKYKVFKVGEVALMADEYRDLVFESYHNATQTINLDPQTLRELACNAKTIKFISTAVDKEVSMTLEYAKLDENDEYYYDLEEIFGKGTLCPPPNNCGITTDTMRGLGFTKEQIDSICSGFNMKDYTPIPPEEAAKMAQEYLEALKKDYRKVIQQIVLDPVLLYQLLCCAEAFKLIGAADEKGEITMLILYQKSGTVTYYNIKDVFGASALCPPPDNCGIPYNGMIKKNSKRPVQK